MSLNKFQLTPFLLQQLYKNSLVTIDNQQSKSITLKKELVFLGKNEKRILVLVAEENAVYLKDEDLNFLINILNACKLSLSDIALVNYHKNKAAVYKTLIGEFNPTMILFFGIEPAILEFPLQFPHYQLQSYNEQTYLFAPPLDMLRSDKKEKTKLWEVLQKLFPL